MTQLKRLSSCISDPHAWDPDAVLAYAPTGAVTWAAFLAAVARWRQTVGAIAEVHVAVQISRLDEFLACLWACWRLAKIPVLSSNGFRDLGSVLTLSAAQTGSNDDFVAGMEFAAAAQHSAGTILLLFTSGSSGSPQMVEKQFSQLESELDALETVWGASVGGTVFASTVSHHHMFGLPFGLLWPLLRGSAFYASKLQYPESIESLARHHALTLITSPTQLDNLHAGLDWNLLAAQVKHLFSAGAPLSPATAVYCAERFGRAVTEIYGSTETGAVARRALPGEPLWTCLPHMRVKSSEAGAQLQICSPANIDGQRWLDIADTGSVHADGRFELLGRMDSIVKVGGKRISLAALDLALASHAWVLQARTVMLPDWKNRIGAVVALNAEGHKHLVDAGKAAVTHALRTHIEQGFDRIALPRYWRFVGKLPVSTEGKTSQHALLAHFTRDTAVVLPELLATEALADRPGYRLTLGIPANLHYFSGHFPGTPVLAGVVQLAWAIHYGRERFDGLETFSHLEAIKFHNVILPEQRVFLDLQWHSDAGKLAFNFSSPRARHSSGRILFKRS